MKKMTYRGRIITLAVALCACAWTPTPFAQDGNAETAIEIVREGIPHDALYALDMSGAHGLAVGAFGLMLETSDGGGTWNLVAPQTGLALLGIARHDNGMMVVGQRGFMMRKQGDGDWETIDSGFEERMLNVAMNNSGVAVVVGEFGFIAVSKDGGSSWNRVEIIWDDYNEEGYEPHLYDAIVYDDGTILVAGEFGLILRSTDGGETFPAVNTGEQSVFDMHMANDGSNSGFAVGQEGLILRTGDNGETWQQLDGGTKANLLGVWSGNSEVVITGIREMLRSSDDGQSFSKTPDIQVIRTWFQGVDAGVTETKAGDEGFLRAQSVYVVGHRATIARVVR